MYVMRVMYVMCVMCVMYVCMHACMHASMDGWMDGWMDGCLYVCAYVCMHACMDGWVYGWMDVWIYVCMTACIMSHVAMKHVRPRLRVAGRSAGLTSVVEQILMTFGFKGAKARVRVGPRCFVCTYCMCMFAYIFFRQYTMHNMCACLCVVCVLHAAYLLQATHV